MFLSPATIEAIDQRVSPGFTVTWIKGEVVWRALPAEAPEIAEPAEMTEIRRMERDVTAAHLASALPRFVRRMGVALFRGVTDTRDGLKAYDIFLRLLPRTAVESGDTLRTSVLMTTVHPTTDKCNFF